MKILQNIVFLFLAVVLFTTPAISAGTKNVGMTAEGRHYNEVWKRFYPAEIVVYVDARDNFYISTETLLIVKRGYVTRENLVPLVDALKKGLEWSEKAKNNKLEITKEIASFVYEIGQQGSTGVSLTFFSASGGEQTDVILFIKDFEFDTTLHETRLYLNPAQVRKLILVLNKVPETCVELKRQIEKSKILD